MNMSSRCRNGRHNLSRALNRLLDHACSRYATTMLAGARRPRQPHPLRVVCKLLGQFIRNWNGMAKRDPHIFGPHAHRYFLDTLEEERYERDWEVAIRKVYGPLAPGQRQPVSTLWTDRYEPDPSRRRIFLNWFKDRYGPH
jgi:hypothetical protein